MTDLIEAASLAEKLTIAGILFVCLAAVAVAYWITSKAHLATLKEYLEHERASAEAARKKADEALLKVGEVKDAVAKNASKLELLIETSRGRRE